MGILVQLSMYIAYKIIVFFLIFLFLYFAYQLNNICIHGISSFGRFDEFLDTHTSLFSKNSDFV